MDWFCRTEAVLGPEAISKLKHARIAIFGLGGVGSWTAEALARSGVGFLRLIDKDTVSLSNLNRQLPALHSTLDRNKADVLRDRFLDINPELELESRVAFYLPEQRGDLLDGNLDYIVDAIDNMTAKIDLIVEAQKRGIPIISAMGTGNKKDPTRFRVCDIYKTTTDPLARILRRELRERNIPAHKVVFSDEEPCGSIVKDENGRSHPPGSLPFVPPVVGFILAAEVVKDLIGE